jgi:hypothetical protein
MLTLWGEKQRFCDGISRRGFLQIGAFGAGLTLADMLRQQAGAAPVPAASSTPKAAIMVYLPGGPSHMDMWDLKPEAPREYKGEFNPISTNVPGCQISEYFPLQAKMWDKLSAIRSIVSVDEHSDTLVMTGWSDNQNRTQQRPSFGSVVSKVRGNTSDVPPFVSLRGMSRGTEPGYLGIAHRPFSPSGPGMRNLQLPGGVDAVRNEDRKTLLRGFDDIRREVDATGTMKGMDSFTSRAFDMVASGTVRKALDLKNEEPRSRERYKGIESFLSARRLVESGVGCVTLSYGGWDTHGQNFVQLKKQLPVLDRGIANLVQDLHDRGMEKDVVVVVWGEFGRTPRVNGGAGRDHWSPVMSAMVAGGGLRMGQMVGASSPRGEYPRDRRFTVQNVLSTIYHAVGIDPSATFNNGSGRPMHILEDREPIRELI